MNKLNLLHAGLLIASMLIGLAPSLVHSSETDAKESHSPSVVHWEYSGAAGPSNWHKISDKFALCGSGKRQSPVDIQLEMPANLYPLVFRHQSIPLQVVNNGHTLQANYGTLITNETVKIGGKTYPIKQKPVYNSQMMLGDLSYKLLQLHFHTPSEHAINGRRAAMEVHMVHQSADGNLAVVGVLLSRGEQNSLLQQILDNASPTINRVNAPQGLTINASDLLPANRQFFHYSGSLTTPPCSENVNWFVMKSEMQVSDQQIKRFAQLIGNNARPLQEINWRSMLISE